jgi:predicted phage tail component-like protein
MIPGAFSLKAIKSSVFKLYSKSLSRPVLAQLRSNSIVIYGKDGVIDHGNNDHDTLKIPIHIEYIGTSYMELRKRSREIAAWLYTAKWEKLIYEDEPDKYYLVKVSGEVNLDNLFRLGRMDITFECQPFAYMVIDTDADPTWEEADFPWEIDMPWEMSEAYKFTATANTSFEFENPGTIDIDNSSPQGSKFNVVITGTWTTLSVSLNGKTLDYVGAGSGVLEIDNIDMEATLDGLNDLDNIEGDIDSFLSIVPGQNSISVSGTGLNITVQLAFAPMWL